MVDSRGADGVLMRRVLIALLLAAVVCGSLFGFAYAKRPKPTWSVLAALPARIQMVRSIGEDYLVAAGDEGLFRVNGTTGEYAPLFDLNGLEVVDIEVAGDVAHLLTFTPASRRSDLYLVDPTNGNFIRSIALGGGVTDLAGFLPNGRLVIVQGVQVRFLEVETGRTRTKDRVQTSGGILNRGHRVGDRLYVARSYAGGLAVIDTEQRTLLEMIDLEPWLVNVAVAGRLAYVDVKEGGMGVVDLDSREFRDVDYADVLVDPDGRAYALTGTELLHLDARGEPAEHWRLPQDMIEEFKGRSPQIVRVTDDHAVIAVGHQLLELVPAHKMRDKQSAVSRQPVS